MTSNPSVSSSETNKSIFFTDLLDHNIFVIVPTILLMIA